MEQQVNKENLTKLLFDLCNIQDHITHCNEQGMARVVVTWQAVRSQEIHKIVKLFTNLQADYNRLFNAAKGWGMPSEMDTPEEVAVLVDGLYRRIERLNERLEKAGLDMPCEFCGGETGHKTNCPRGA